MEPIIVYIQSNKDGRVSFSKKEFEHYIKEAYNQWLDEGRGYKLTTSNTPHMTIQYPNTICADGVHIK